MDTIGREEMNHTGETGHLPSGTLTIENTTYCGAKCVMCPRDEYGDTWQHMDTAFFNQVVDQGYALGMRSLDATGFGDPFMDPKYRQKLEYVKATYPDVRIYVGTTAHLLYPKHHDWVAQCIDTLKISNYGHSPEVYQAIHGGTVRFEKVKENLEALLARAREDRPWVIMRFLVFPENEHQIDAWRQHWEPKADEILIWLPHNYGGGFHRDEFDRFKEAKLEARTCGRPFSANLFVRENGEVSVCCFDFNRKLIVGDLRRETLRDVVLGDRLREIREIHAAGGEAILNSNTICKDCDQIYDRDHALLYTSNPARSVDSRVSHPELAGAKLREPRNGQGTFPIKLTVR
jgi:MoaA/NifB/PqqE/SkfB family radical SAM enzyme